MKVFMDRFFSQGHFFKCLIVFVCLCAHIFPSQPKRTLVTACNQMYYDCCLTLIASIHRTSLHCVDQIYVYNLGLADHQIQKLNSTQKVRVICFEEIQEKYPQMDIAYFYQQPDQFGWKQVCLDDALDQKC